MALRHAVLVTIIATSTLAPTLAAQCPDGALRPCAVAKPAPLADPPLDDRAWIVLPFTNIARAAELDWLSEASVHLLYIDMSRWTDLRIVDDERVSDLLHDVPQTGRSQLGLAAGLAIARHAGAGKLVMGDVLREGPRTTITAKVYDVRKCADVRTCARVRTVTQRVTGTDSLSAAFSALAQLVLDLQPPAGIRLSGLGTRSTEALRAYVLGVQARNRWSYDSAQMYFARAVARDSTFALAQLRFGAGLRALGPDSADRASRAYTAATRYGAALPERERILIALAQQGVTPPLQCSLTSRLLVLDSADAQGWLGTARCVSRNSRLVADGAGGVRREVSLNAALRALQRAIELRPDDIALPDALVPGIYRTSQVRGCMGVGTGPFCPLGAGYWSALGLDGDSLVLRFERVQEFDPPERRASSAAARRALLTSGRDLMARWSAANPQVAGGHAFYGTLLLDLGDLAGADREFTATSSLYSAPSRIVSDPNWRRSILFRSELEWRRDRPDLATIGIDSLDRNLPVITAFGRFGKPTAGVGRGGRASTGPLTANVSALSAAFSPVWVGVVPPDFEQTMRSYVDALVGPDSAQRRVILRAGTTYAFHARRTRPAADTANAFSLFRFQAQLARGDTVRARAALAEYDVWGDSTAENYYDGHEMFSAESHVELSDTATAWKRIEPLGRRWSGYNLDQSGGYLDAVRAAGRAWLLYADLAAATGHRDEARRGYKMIIGMWEHGDPPVQPLVTRAKQALAKLGA
jgi:tetratricopeptide (TPR) repeat protein/TolB-like protein